MIYNGLLGYAHTSPSASPPAPTTGRAGRARPTRGPSCSSTAPSPTCRTAGRRSRRCWRTTATASSRSTTAPTAAASSSASTGRRHRRVGRAARGLRRPRPRRDRRRPGRPGRPFPGRTDAPLLPEVPARGGQGPHPGRALVLESRHHARRDLHPRGLLPGASGLFGSCPACEQQQAGSSFLTDLNAGGDTVGGVHYTVIQSRNDEVVTPYDSAFLSGPDVTNILLQQQCPLDQGEHLSMPLRPHRRGRRAHRARPRAPGAAGVHAGPSGERRLAAADVAPAQPQPVLLPQRAARVAGAGALHHAAALLAGRAEIAADHLRRAHRGGFGQRRGRAPPASSGRCRRCRRWPGRRCRRVVGCRAPSCAVSASCLARTSWVMMPSSSSVSVSSMKRLASQRMM